MKYNPEIHRRHSIRLKDFDYSSEGNYYITLCTQDRENLFGEIIDNKILLNDAGLMLQKWYNEIENKFKDIKCDNYVIMPNHFHTIIKIVGADLRVCPEPTNDETNRNQYQSNADLRVCPEPYPDNKQNKHDISNGGYQIMKGEHIGSPLHRVVQWLKTMTTNEYIRGVKNNNWKSFNGKLWQRNYYEHIIRNEIEYNKICDYKINNPMNW